MPYTLNFSDPSKPNKVTVPDMPPGINTVDTSLSLIGKGYPNYGEKTAENFLNLLENFASPYPGPRNPIEGQLWYDTTNPNHKVLKVRDGINWSNANGIYQQSDDPRISAEAPATLRSGDIWVDTSNYQLKIFNNSGWTLVGPMITEGSTTGLSVETLYGTADIPEVSQGHPVIKLWAEGDIVAIISNKTFIPKSVIPGFSELVPGINLRKTASGNDKVPVLNGTARNAENLSVGGTLISANRFLRKDDNTSKDQGGQIITGKLFFKTPTDSINNEIFGQGEYGIVINNQSSVDDSRYVQFYKGDKNAVILNNNPTGSIVLKVNDGISFNLIRAVEVSSTSTIIRTPVTLTQILSVFSSTTIGGNLTVGSTATLQSGLIVNGTTVVNNDITLNGKLTVNSTTSIIPDVAGVNDIGSSTKYFNQIFVSYIGTSTTGTVVYGKVKGSATSLEYGTAFKLRGQVEANTFIFNGRTTSSNISSVERNGLTGIATIKTTAPHNLVTGTSITVECSSSTFDVIDALVISTTPTSISYYNVGSTVTTATSTGTVIAAPATFNASLTPSAISSQTEITTASSNLTLLALNTLTNSLGKIKYLDLFRPVQFPGMITAYGSNLGIPNGWLLCNGDHPLKSTYPDLFSVIGTTYGVASTGTHFVLPNFVNTATGGYPIYYIIKY